MKFSHSQKVSHTPFWIKIMMVIIPILIIFAGVSYFAVNNWYDNNIQPLNAESTMEIVVVVEPGSSAVEIGEMLEDEGVIKSSTAFSWFTDRNGVRTELQAGTYRFSPSQSVEDIVEVLVSGDVETDLVTILPGKRLDQVSQGMVDSGFPTNQVVNALDQKYDHPLLRFKPAKATLEGYIFPETYQINSDTTAEELVEISMTEFNSRITNSLINKIKRQGLDMHEAFILASIIHNETANIEEQAKVAQVFLKRLNEGMVLGSDPTFYYAAAITGQELSTTIDHPYNTRIYPGLPPGPISNFNFSALESIANPANTDYLFFVAGDDGKTYFSKTFAEHQRLTAEKCKELCILN